MISREPYGPFTDLQGVHRPPVKVCVVGLGRPRKGECLVWPKVVNDRIGTKTQVSGSQLQDFLLFAILC